MHRKEYLHLHVASYPAMITLFEYHTSIWRKNRPLTHAPFVGLGRATEGGVCARRGAVLVTSLVLDLIQRLERTKLHRVCIFSDTWAHPSSVGPSLYGSLFLLLLFTQQRLAKKQAHAHFSAKAWKGKEQQKGGANRVKTKGANERESSGARPSLGLSQGTE